MGGTPPGTSPKRNHTAAASLHLADCTGSVLRAVVVETPFPLRLSRTPCVCSPLIHRQTLGSPVVSSNKSIWATGMYSAKQVVGPSPAGRNALKPPWPRSLFGAQHGNCWPSDMGQPWDRHLSHPKHLHLPDLGGQRGWHTCKDKGWCPEEGVL